MKQIKELQRLLGKKTMENELLKEAVEYAAASQDTAVATVKAYIESHLSDELDRDTLAAMVYLNADYLSHLFKKDTGSSLINYVIDRRIARSKELLAKGEMSIRDIAITCGFQNISYFSRQFKKSTGMTPRQFRN